MPLDQEVHPGAEAIFVRIGYLIENPVSIDPLFTGETGADKFNSFVQKADIKS